MKKGEIKQTVQFMASPEEVYELLINAEKYQAFIGGEVIMNPIVGGKFSVFDGYCHGTNLILEKGKKIVQHWHFAEDGWPDDHMSVCSFLFQPDPQGCKLVFKQTGVPIHKVEDLAAGWIQYYWEPMKEALVN